MNASRAVSVMCLVVPSWIFVACSPSPYSADGDGLKQADSARSSGKAKPKTTKETPDGGAPRGAADAGAPPEAELVDKPPPAPAPADAGAPPPASGNGVVGTSGGAPFAAGKLLAFVGPGIDGRDGLRIILSNAAGGIGCDRFLPSANTTELWLDIPNEEIVRGVFAGPASELVERSTQNDICASNPDFAQTGLVQLSIVGGTIIGSLTATFAGGDSLGGRFEIAICAGPPLFGNDCLGR